MSITELIRLKRALESINTADVVKELASLKYQVNNIKTQVDKPSDQILEHIDSLTAIYDEVINRMVQSVDFNRAKLATVGQAITDLSHDLYAKSYDLESWPVEALDTDFIRNDRALPLTPDIEQAVQQRLTFYTSWKYPALELGCRDGEWTRHMVAADPLYVMDRYQEFLNNTNEQFLPEYQSRLRKYLLVNNDLNNLPKGQFGFIFSWNFFNYVSLDTITHMLPEIYNLMRPGGVFMFSYNDGDTPTGAAMSDSQVQTYLPKSILLPTCRAAGFEILAEHDYETRAHWLEIKKPGTLHTVKAHQVLGKIERRTP